MPRELTFCEKASQLVSGDIKTIEALQVRTLEEWSRTKKSARCHTQSAACAIVAREDIWEIQLCQLDPSLFAWWTAQYLLQSSRLSLIHFGIQYCKELNIHRTFTLPTHALDLTVLETVWRMFLPLPQRKKSARIAEWVQHRIRGILTNGKSW